MGRLFGTDGVRGLANVDLTAGMALGLAAAAATVLVDEGGPAHPRALVARDPRASGEFLSAAVVAGLAGSGVDVLDVGVVPTPALRTWCRPPAPTSASCCPPRTTPCPTTG